MYIFTRILIYYMVYVICKAKYKYIYEVDL